jgi:hypothetical protein
MRYLDAVSSNMTLQDVASLSYLVYLDLSRCALEDLQDVPPLLNLHSLKLAHNNIQTMTFSAFLPCEQLQALDLSDNPLATVYVDPSLSALHYNLQRLNISGTRLTGLESANFSILAALEILDVAKSSLSYIGAMGMAGIRNLKVLNITGNDIHQFPPKVFYLLHRLESLLTDSFTLCCQDNLPSHFDHSKCDAPKELLSSCADLLRSDAYRACLWLLAVLTVLGNVGSFSFRVLAERSQSGFHVLVTQLCLADLLMGLYLVMLGQADSAYRGVYFRQERQWRGSITCSVAGFLALLSSEVSAFIICLITLDRFLVLRFPFSQLRFHRKSALVACGVCWMLGILLAAVPVLPAFHHWQLYGGTGICLPLPTATDTFPGWHYSFGVTIVFNFVLFLFVALGQASIFWSVRINTMGSDVVSSRLKDVIVARQLLTVVVSNFLCWFPIGLLGMLAFKGVPIPGDVNVAVAIFILPINPALNPFIYTFNMLVEKSRKRREERLLQWLAKNAATFK